MKKTIEFISLTREPEAIYPGDVEIIAIGPNFYGNTVISEIEHKTAKGQRFIKDTGMTLKEVEKIRVLAKELFMDPRYNEVEMDLKAKTLEKYYVAL